MSWQKKIFERLRAAPDQWLRLGDLYEEVMLPKPQIPMHDAMRHYRRSHKIPSDELDKRPSTETAQWCLFTATVNRIGVDRIETSRWWRYRDRVRLRPAADRLCEVCGSPLSKATWSGKKKFVCLNCQRQSTVPQVEAPLAAALIPTEPVTASYAAATEAVAPMADAAPIDYSRFSASDWRAALEQLPRDDPYRAVAADGFTELEQLPRNDFTCDWLAPLEQMVGDALRRADAKLSETKSANAMMAELVWHSRYLVGEACYDLPNALAQLRVSRRQESVSATLRRILYDLLEINRYGSRFSAAAEIAFRNERARRMRDGKQRKPKTPSPQNRAFADMIVEATKNGRKPTIGRLQLINDKLPPDQQMSRSTLARRLAAYKISGHAEPRSASDC